MCAELSVTFGGRQGALYSSPETSKIALNSPFPSQYCGTSPAVPPSNCGSLCLSLADLVGLVQGFSDFFLSQGLLSVWKNSINPHTQTLQKLDLDTSVAVLNNCQWWFSRQNKQIIPFLSWPIWQYFVVIKINYPRGHNNYQSQILIKMIK